MGNLFVDLSKHLSERHEDFLTNAFVYVLNYLLDNERELGVELLNNICFGNSELQFENDEEVSVITQISTDEGTPDIEIKSADKCIYIEVKHDSGLGYKQIERYKKAMEKQHASIRRVILLTKFTQDFDENNQGGKPDKHLRWYQIHRYLETLRPAGQTAEFLVEQFKKFLEGKQMAIQRVSWEYTNGIRAFNHLIDMVGAAIEELGIKIYSKSSGWDWKGYYLEDKLKLCAVWYSDPDSLYYQVANVQNFSPQKEGFPYDHYEEDNSVYFELSFEETHFFALQKEGQLDILKKFISACHAEAKLIIRS